MEASSFGQSSAACSSLGVLAVEGADSFLFVLTLFKTNVLGVKTDVLGEFLECSTSYDIYHLSLKKKKGS